MGFGEGEEGAESVEGGGLGGCWGEREGVDEVLVGLGNWDSGELWFPFAGWFWFRAYSW